MASMKDSIEPRHIGMWDHWEPEQEAKLHALRRKSYRVRAKKRELMEPLGLLGVPDQMLRDKLHSLDLELAAIEDERLILKGFLGRDRPPACDKVQE